MQSGLHQALFLAQPFCFGCVCLCKRPAWLLSIESPFWDEFGTGNDEMGQDLTGFDGFLVFVAFLQKPYKSITCSR